MKRNILFLSIFVCTIFLTVNALGVTANDVFNPDANSTVNVIAVQSDGKILVGGSFTSIGGVARDRIARLNEDGSVDQTFNSSANGYVRV
ncbi:MAG: delta-60 repeat domain-containing protein [Anaerolineae bacterium]|nr:delta-60 repeat domain-containing protein [Anaerolineae bacterium]